MDPRDSYFRLDPSLAQRRLVTDMVSAACQMPWLHSPMMRGTQHLVPGLQCRATWNHSTAHP